MSETLLTGSYDTELEKKFGELGSGTTGGFWIVNRRQWVKFTLDEVGLSKPDSRCAAEMMTTLMELWRPDRRGLNHSKVGGKVLLSRNEVAAWTDISRRDFENGLELMRELGAISTERHRYGQIVTMDFDGMTELMGVGMGKLELRIGHYCLRGETYKYNQRQKRRRELVPGVADYIENYVKNNQK